PFGTRRQRQMCIRDRKRRIVSEILVKRGLMTAAEKAALNADMENPGRARSGLDAAPPDTVPSAVAAAVTDTVPPAAVADTTI
ncbi:MAG: hypothetical protein QUS35_06620, partial [bacterium]|nr:hypothetical protein [bacterium]